MKDPSDLELVGRLEIWTCSEATSTGAATGSPHPRSPSWSVRNAARSRGPGEKESERSCPGGRHAHPRGGHSSLELFGTSQGPHLSLPMNIHLLPALCLKGGFGNRSGGEPEACAFSQPVFSVCTCLQHSSNTYHSREAFLTFEMSTLFIYLIYHCIVLTFSYLILFYKATYFLKYFILIP